MLIPKAMVVERVRGTSGQEAADRADAQLPEKVDTEADAALLRELGVDPSALDDELGGQAPAVG